MDDVPQCCVGCAHAWIRKQMLGPGYVYSGDPPPCVSCERALKPVDRYAPANAESAGTSANVRRYATAQGVLHEYYNSVPVRTLVSFDLWLKERLNAPESPAHSA